MESGSILHLALLRKTSNAKRRHRIISNNQREYLETFKSEIHEPQENDNDGFTLSGWATEEKDKKSFRIEKVVKLGDIRNPHDKSEPLKSQRNVQKSSEFGQRLKIKTQNSRKDQNSSFLSCRANDKCEKLKEIMSLDFLQRHEGSGKINEKDGRIKDNIFSKENEISYQLTPNNYKVEKKKKAQAPFFTNFINLNNIRARKFIKV